MNWIYILVCLFLIAWLIYMIRQPMTKCPKCGSTNLFLKINKYETKYKCKNCGQEFEKPNI